MSTGEKSAGKMNNAEELVAKKKPYRFVLFLIVRAAAAVIYLLPRNLALALARFAGWLGFFVVTRQKRKILENLRTAYPEKGEAEIRRIGKKVMENLSQTAVEILQMPKWDAGKIDQIVDYSDVMDYFESLRKECRGVISLTGHIGNWELLAGALCLKGVPMTVIGRRIYYEPYNRWISKIRSSVKVRVIYQDSSPRELLGCLKRNEVIGLLPDQDVEKLPGIYVDFFGRPAYTLVAPVKLALKTGAPLLIGFLIRIPGNRYRLVLRGVIRPVIETTYEEAVEKYTIQWMKVFENIIREYPEQWAWMHDRWKTQVLPEVATAGGKGVLNGL